MAVELTIRHDSTEPLALDDARLEEVAAVVLAAEEVDRPCGVSVSVVDDAEIAELNAEWRGIDRATDVLSFECESPWDEDLADGEPCELGDIVLAPAYIKAQAARLETPLEVETTLLYVHGLLHLLGYDHLEDDEAAEMEAREDELVSRLTGRPLERVRTTRHGGEDA